MKKKEKEKVFANAGRRRREQPHCGGDGSLCLREKHRRRSGNNLGSQLPSAFFPSASGSQRGVILLPRGQLALSGGTSGCRSLGEVGGGCYGS